jgi:ABC-type transport system involved in multi-copper enzyme maturation permease subunit
MGKIASIARYTFIEIFRNKIYYVLLLFAVVMLGSTLLLGALGGEQWGRMLTDFGLMSIEALSLLVAVFAAVTLVLEEMESRTLYLILTRPVSRYQFVLGRFLGLLLLLGTTYFLMAAGHLLLLATMHVHPDRQYLLSLLYSWEKIMLITALAMAFSLFATSTISAIVFTLFFWVMGHFSSEMRFLAQKSAQPGVSWLFSSFYYLVPNFQVMNVRDLPSTALAGTGWLWPALGYGITYTAACLVIVVMLFRKKEF